MVVGLFCIPVVCGLLLAAPMALCYETLLMLIFIPLAMLGALPFLCVEVFAGGGAIILAPCKAICAYMAGKIPAVVLCALPANCVDFCSGFVQECVPGICMPLNLML
jgi:hypothetical protein